MSLATSANAYVVANGTCPITGAFIASYTPSSSNVVGPNGPWKLGQRWVDTSTNTIYSLTSLSASGGVVSGTWSVESGNSSLDTLSGDTGTAVPSSGNIQIAGTANQISTLGSSSAITLSLPSAITTPGSLTTTTSLSATTTVTAGTGLTVTTGDATITAGNVIINGAAKQLRVHGGAVTDFIGTATLTNGTSGAIANTNIAATDRIFIQRTAANASTTLGELSYTISAGASFTITSLIVGTPGSPQTGDASTVTYFIVRQV